MADYPVPKNGVAYVFYAGLPSQANVLIFQASPTIAAGDFKASIDGGALANLATLPTVTPAAGKMVKFSLSAAEMTGDNICVVCSDVAGAEWCDQIFNIQTSARGIADLAYPTVSGRSLGVSAAGQAGLDWANIGGGATVNNLVNTTVTASGGAVLYGGAGSINYEFTVYDVDGITRLTAVDVFVSSDIAGVNTSVTKQTDALGRVYFALNPATVYFWCARNDRVFSNPYAKVVS